MRHIINTINHHICLIMSELYILNKDHKKQQLNLNFSDQIWHCFRLQIVILSNFDLCFFVGLVVFGGRGAAYGRRHVVGQSGCLYLIGAFRWGGIFVVSMIGSEDSVEIKPWFGCKLSWFANKTSVAQICESDLSNLPDSEEI
jgi:hypothetical protein